MLWESRHTESASVPGMIDVRQY